MSFAPGQSASKTEIENRLTALEEAVAGSIEERLAVLEAAMVGPVFFSGSGDPDPASGADGDHYFDKDNGRFFQKVAGGWALLGEIWLDTSAG